MNRNDDLLNQALKTEQAGCRKDDTQCCGKCEKPTYDQLAAQLADVVEENAALKKAIPPLKMVNSFDDSWDDVSIAEEIGFNHAISTILRNLPETPATDHFLAEQRAVGVEMFAEHYCNLQGTAESLGFENLANTHGTYAGRARMFAEKLRNEVKV